MKVFILFLYIWKGEITFKKQLFPGSIEACAQTGAKLLNDILKDPRLDQVLYAHCIELPAEEAKANAS